MASGNHIYDNKGCLSKFLDDGIVLLMAAIVKVKQAAAAVRMKICACCGNHEPPNQVEEGGEAAGQHTRPAELIECGRASPVMSNLGWRWQLLGIGSARGNADDTESGPSVELAETGGRGGALVPEPSPEEIKEEV